MADLIKTLQEALTVDPEHFWVGYHDGYHQEECPADCNRSYLHGWRQGAFASGYIPIDEAQQHLINEIILSNYTAGHA